MSSLCGCGVLFEPGLAEALGRSGGAGHHTAYETAVRLCSHCSSPGTSSTSGREAVRAPQELEVAVTRLGADLDDTEFSILAYGVGRLLGSLGHVAAHGRLEQAILARDSHWPSYALTASWNDSFGLHVPLRRPLPTHLVTKRLQPGA